VCQLVHALLEDFEQAYVEIIRDQLRRSERITSGEVFRIIIG
jgi:hypothetical protein